MPFTFKRFFKSEPAPIAKLRALSLENAESLKLSDEISARAEAARVGLHASIVVLSEKPSMENAMAFTEAHERHSRAGALDEAARICRDTVHAQIVSRTRPAVVDALQSVLDGLGTEMNKVSAAAKADGERLGLEIGGTEHPVHKALEARLKEASSHLNKFQSDDSVSYDSFAEVQTSVAFVLGS